MASRNSSQRDSPTPSLEAITQGLTPSEIVTREAYETLAESWAQGHGGLDVMADQARELKRFLPSGRVIDLGCGPGRDAALLVGMGYEVVGVDFSENMLAIARAAAPQAQFHLRSLYELGFEDGSFDGFWACSSLQDIPRNRVHRVLQEIRRVTRPEGVGFVTVKESYGDIVLKDTLRGVERFQAGYTKNGFQSVLEEGGFEVIGFSKNLGAFDKSTSWLRYFVRRGP